MARLPRLLVTYRSTISSTLFPVTGLGALRVEYVAFTAAPDFRLTLVGAVNVSDGVDCFSWFSSAATLAVVAGPALVITTWMMLFLSENVTSLPEPFRVQPSGYDML